MNSSGDPGKKTRAQEEPDTAVARLEHLRGVLREAAQDKPRFRVFLDRLGAAGVELDARLTRAGRVTQLQYEFEGQRFDSRQVGEQFSWTGLQKHLGVGYVKIRDLAGTPTGGMTTNAVAQPLGDMPRGEVDTHLSHVIRELSQAQNQILEKTKRVDARLDTLAADVKVLRDDLRQVYETTRSASGEAFDTRPEAGLNAPGQHTLGAAVTALEQAARRTDSATQRLRQESLWVSFSIAFGAALVSAVLSGLWFADENAQSVEKAQREIAEHIDRQAAEDPLRQYFNRIMEKLDR